MREMPDQTPVYEKEACPHCGAIVWHRVSRIDPCTYMEADFLKEFIVDEASRQITPITLGKVH